MAWVQAGVDLLTGLLLFRALMGIAVSLAELVELERERERERASPQVAAPEANPLARET